MTRISTSLAAMAAICVAFAVPAVGNEENPVDFMNLHQVEIIFHQAASTKNLDLMMSLFADDATLSVGGKTYSGKDQVRTYFATVAGIVPATKPMDGVYAGAADPSQGERRSGESVFRMSLCRCENQGNQSAHVLG
jgi:ketosteroid isomerase-like protein